MSLQSVIYCNKNFTLGKALEREITFGKIDNSINSGRK